MTHTHLPTTASCPISSSLKIPLMARAVWRSEGLTWQVGASGPLNRLGKVQTPARDPAILGGTGPPMAAAFGEVVRMGAAFLDSSPQHRFLSTFSITRASDAASNMASVSSSTVTIDRGYFDTLIRRYVTGPTPNPHQASAPMLLVHGGRHLEADSDPLWTRAKFVCADSALARPNPNL